jgi:hypothetical protein
MAGDPERRYEMLESRTGGESWILRAMSGRPIPGQPSEAPAAAGFRLRTEEATQSYRVEKQAGERWQTLASFLVQVGECREPERYSVP